MGLGSFFLGSQHLARCVLAQSPEGSVFWPHVGTGDMAVALGKSFASLGLCCYLIFNNLGLDEMVPVLPCTLSTAYSGSSLRAVGT